MAKKFKQFPVLFDGFVIGVGEITDNGDVVTIFFDPVAKNPVGLEIRDGLLFHLIDSITIRPNYTQPI